MYRLAAAPFLERGWAAAVVGYRTYPDGTADDQRSDCDQALRRLADDYPGWCRRDSGGGSVALVGHSSGARDRE
jgi:acetyl esterase/lipase